MRRADETLRAAPPRTARASHAVRIGCAGWSIPGAHAARFPPDGSKLERYAQVFDGVEINSSFYRPHRPATYRRWADSVPPDFRFAVKMPKAISHQARLAGCEELVDAFLGQVEELGERLGCLLLQLPPSLAWNPAVALPFLAYLRRHYAGPLACEPRHASWFRAPVDRALRELAIARVAADPAKWPRAALPGGDRHLLYIRLHGSPRMYYDAYAPATLQLLAVRLQRLRAGQDCWCIFDNTAAGHATHDALDLQQRLRGEATTPA